MYLLPVQDTECSLITQPVIVDFSLLISLECNNANPCPDLLVCLEKLSVLCHWYKSEALVRARAGQGLDMAEPPGGKATCVTKRSSTAWQLLHTKAGLELSLSLVARASVQDVQRAVNLLCSVSRERMQDLPGL